MTVARGHVHAALWDAGLQTRTRVALTPVMAAVGSCAALANRFDLLSSLCVTSGVQTSSPEIAVRTM